MTSSSNQNINSTNSEKLRVIFKALEFAANKHRRQKRKGAMGIPYINHPIEVCNFLLKYSSEPTLELIVAAVLHDTVEDTRTTPEEIEEQFGTQVMKLVMEVSDDKHLSSAKRKRLQIEKARFLSPGARALKIADKTCNVLDVLHTRIQWTRKQKIYYINWAISVVDQFRESHPHLIREFDLAVNEAEQILKTRFRNPAPLS